MSAIQLTSSDRWEVVTPVSSGKEDHGVVHVPNSGIVTSNGQYVLPIGSLPSQPIYVTASGNEVAANGVSGIQYQVKRKKNQETGVSRCSVQVIMCTVKRFAGHPPNPKCRRNAGRVSDAGIR